MLRHVPENFKTIRYVSVAVHHARKLYLVCATNATVSYVIWRCIGEWFYSQKRGDTAFLSLIAYIAGQIYDSELRRSKAGM